MLKTALTNHVLHAAGVLLSRFRLYPSIHQQSGKEAVFFIGLLRYLPAHIGQAEEEVPVHGEEASFFQGSYRVTHAGLGDSHVPGHIHGAYQAFFLLEYQHGLQIILAGSVQFYLNHRL